MNETIPYVSPQLELIQINLESSMLQVSNRSFNEDEDDIFEAKEEE